MVLLQVWKLFRIDIPGHLQMHLCLVFPQLLSLAVFVGWLDCTCSFVGTLFILGQKLNKRIIFAGEVMTCELSMVTKERRRTLNSLTFSKKITIHKE